MDVYFYTYDETSYGRVSPGRSETKISRETEMRMILFMRDMFVSKRDRRVGEKEAEYNIVL